MGLTRLLRPINAAAAIVAGLCILAMTIIGAADVFGIFVLKRPIPGAFEFTEILMVASIFLALAMAQANRQHVSVEVLQKVLPAGIKRLSWRLNCLLTLAFFVLMSWIAWKVAANSFMIGEFSSGLIQVPVWPARVALAVGTTLISLQALAGLLEPDEAIAPTIAKES
ncbi:MAG: TRAP transporter small permease subunit [Rhizobiales bacterium]|nr:TRAP transporter small permease subunit [Hyphomicrobiales bacterium]